MRHLKQLILIALALLTALLGNNVFAVTCTPDSSVVSGTCSDLTINLSNTSIAINSEAVVNNNTNLNSVQVNDLGGGVSNLDFLNYGRVEASSANQLNAGSSNVGAFVGTGTPSLNSLINSGVISAQSGNVTNDSGSVFLSGSGNVFGFSLDGLAQSVINSGSINLSSGSVANATATAASFGGSSGAVYGFNLIGSNSISTLTNSGALNIVGGNVSNGELLTFGATPNNVYGVSLYTNVGTLINSGTVNLTAGSTENNFSGGMTFGGSGGRAYAIFVGTGITPTSTSPYNLNSFINSGSINLNGGNVSNIGNSGFFAPRSGSLTGLFNGGSIGTIINTGQITGNGDSSFYGIYNGTGPSVSIASLINDGSIVSSSSAASFGNGVNNNSVITSFINNGLISSTVGASTVGENASAIGIYNANHSSHPVQINSLTNNGQILAAAGSSGYVIGIYNGESGGNSSIIGTLTNNGVIGGSVGSGGTINGITNRGIIDTLNNAQGGNNATAANTALTYTGVLPNNYNVKLTSQSRFGQLSVNNVTGSTTFGISPRSYATLNLSYYGVLQGIQSVNLNGVSGSTLTGNSNGYVYVLTQTDAVNGIWSLNVLSAPVNAIDTQQSLVNTSRALQGTFALQNAVLANSLGYDCNKFGSNSVCISTGGRYTAVSAANGLNNTSALLIGAYRLNQNYRIGAYVDQNLSVNNAGTTVRLGNSTPLIGLFGAWNEKPDGTGTEVKVSAAYGKKNTTVTRQIINTSEPGSGSSQLSSQGAQIIAKHSFAVTDKALVSPYVGLRYTQNNMGGYTEGTSDTVTAPLAFSTLNTRATTALAGVGVNYKVNPTVTTFASAGVEADTKAANGSYSGTNSSISDLTAVNFNANPVRVRASAVLGAYYDVEKNQRFAITGAYRQESYKAVSTTTVMATYTVGL